MKTQNPNIVKQIIPAYPKQLRMIPNDEPYLDIAEFFRCTVQGEGINIGVPSAFLRLQHCTLNCMWCDTEEVWRQGNPYTFDEIFHMIEISGLLADLKAGHHLILTGGSPLRQQEALIDFFEIFEMRYGFLPYLEVENECTLMPSPAMEFIVRCWNNSPKLEHSGNPRELRYKAPVLRELSSYENSWFKFVVGSEKDWKEIERDFLAPKYIRRDQVILMPLGGNIEELEQNRPWTAELSIRENVRFTDRLHVTLWNTLTGV